jgi:hypothetical protein
MEETTSEILDQSRGTHEPEFEMLQEIEFRPRGRLSPYSRVGVGISSSVGARSKTSTNRSARS